MLFQIHNWLNISGLMHKNLTKKQSKGFFNGVNEILKLILFFNNLVTKLSRMTVWEKQTENDGKYNRRNYFKKSYDN